MENVEQVRESAKKEVRACRSGLRYVRDLDNRPPDARDISSQEVGKKNEKLARFDLIPPKALYDLAEHYGKGCRKYGDRNWEKGISWGQAYAALQRHCAEFWAGRSIDEEGNYSLIAVAFWALALHTFSTDKQYQRFDDRSLGAGGVTTPMIGEEYIG